MSPYRVLLAAATGVWLTISEPTVAAQKGPMEFVTQHAGIIDGERIRYTATVERFIEKNGDGRPALSLIAATYVRVGVRDLGRRRPVVFIFNGGPSGSAFDLNMQLGPEILKAGPGTATLWPPTFIDNADSLLDVADLVFFDPAETGFSRVLPGGARAYYYSLDGDAQSLAQLVAAWTYRHHRESSPLYLLGESYGSIRAVVTARVLSNMMPVSGVILFGNSLPIRETSDGIVAAASALPMEAMAAAYHGMVSMRGLTPDKYLDQVYDFAVNEYLPALAKGSALPAMQARRLAKELSGYTGIAAGYYLDYDLIAPRPLTSDTRTLGRAALEPPTPSPPPNSGKSESKAPSDGHNVAAEYMRTVLHVSLPGIQYRSVAPDSYDDWDWGSGCDGWMRTDQLCSLSQRTVFSSYDWPSMLGDLFKSQARFRAMIVAGYYDGLSSIGQTRFMLTHHDYPDSRLVYREYASGHATAADPKARVAVVRDMRAFLNPEGSR